MKNTIFTLLALMCAATAAARLHTATDAAGIAALKTLAAGDTLVLAEGEWKDQNVRLTGAGTAEKPVVVMAAQSGKTIFTGKSSFWIAGEYVIVKGLYFKDVEPVKGTSAIQFRTGTGRNASHCTITDCAITADGLSEDLTDMKWLSLWGTENTVEGCTFIGKVNMGTTLVVWFEEGITPRHTIRGNYFSRPVAITDDKGSKLNGQETIRIGTSEVSMSDGECLVEGNCFYKCNGEVEVVSNKSCRNTYRRNTFIECVGTLTLRHGNGCTVDGNFFFGGAVKGTGGVRIIGEDHRVYNNYMQDLGGDGYYSGITTLQGERNSLINGYFAAKNVDVVFNTLIDCKVGICMNYGSTRQELPIEDVRVSDNVVTTGNDKFCPIYVKLTPEPPVKLSWQNNVVHGGKMTGIGPAAAGARDVDPMIEEQDGLWRPAKGSPIAKYARAGNDFVDHDALGRKRDMAKKVPGAFNPGGKGEIVIPSPSNCGVSWKL